MNRFILFLLVSTMGIFYAGFLYSEDDQSAKIMKADLMIESRMFLTPDGLSNFIKTSEGLSIENRNMLYMKNEKNGILGCFLNALLPSLGSWIQGDILGALIVDIGIVGGAAIGIIGVLTDPNKVTTITSTSVMYTSQSPIAIGGYVIAGGFYIAGLVFPFTYSGDYNSKLKKGLGLTAYHSASDCLNFAYLPQSFKNDQVFHFDLLQFEF